MSKNAIMTRMDNSGGGARYDVEGLRAYCMRINQMSFTVANGWEYFVNKRVMPNGTEQHYVDRRDCERTLPARFVSEAKAALIPPREPPIRY